MPLITTTSDIPTSMQGYYDRALLERAVPALLHSRFGQTRPLPKNQSDRINFRKYASLPANTTPLVEGVTPSGKKLSVSDIYARVKFYGDYVTFTDVLLDTGLDANLLSIADEVLGEQAGLSIDTIHRDVLVAGTTVRYGNGVSARTSVVTAIGDNDVASAVNTLRRNNAKMVREMIMGGAKINTMPIRPAFIAITHPDLEYDIEQLKGWTPVSEYAAQKDVMDEEIGATGNIRWLLTTNSKIWADGGGSVGTTGLKSTSASNIDVYSVLVIAKNAYGMTPLVREGIKNIVKKLGSAGADDPLNQRGTSGWKAATVAKILQQDWMVRIEVGATSL